MSEATKAEITVSGWRPVKKNSSLRGFLTFELADGLVVHDCSFHQRDDGTWREPPHGVRSERTEPEITKLDVAF